MLGIMSKSRGRVLTVAIAYTFPGKITFLVLVRLKFFNLHILVSPGPVGQLISDFQSHKLERLKKTAETQRRLGEVPDSEVVLEECAELKVSYSAV